MKSTTERLAKRLTRSLDRNPANVDGFWIADLLERLHSGAPEQFKAWLVENLEIEQRSTKREIEGLEVDARDEGYRAGEQEAHTEGYTEGYSEGYTEGEVAGGDFRMRHPQLLPVLEAAARADRDINYHLAKAGVYVRMTNV